MNFINTNEQEIKQIIREVTVKAARYLHVPDPEVEDTFALNEKIKTEDEKLFSLINSFSSSYMSFFYMVKTISATKKHAALSDSEQEKLQGLYEIKEKYKQSILQEIKK